MDVLDFLSNLLFYAVELGTYFFEFVGIAILLISGTKGLINYIQKNKFTETQLARGLATGLEFLLGAEILHTVLVRNTTELVTIGGLILLRGLLTILIHWDIKSAKEKHDLQTQISND